MYEALALAIEMNQGKPEDVRTALNYAADLARRTRNPNHLVSVADKLMLKGYYERVGELLDEASAKVPHRAEPLVMSINLARQTRDPVRMARAIDALLSLGWPGNDDYFRREARAQAEKLAQALREDGRSQDADTLLASLPEAESRDLFLRLTWDGNADFDLIVEEPLGAVAQYATPRTVFGGALIKNGYGSRPEEIYVCPRGFDGDYTVRVTMVYSDPQNPPTRLTLEAITHEGSNREHREEHSLSPADPSSSPVVVRLEGGRRTRVLPFVSPFAILESATATDTAPRGTRSQTERSLDPKSAATPSAPRPSADHSPRPQR
jgi:hypothetical protein